MARVVKNGLLRIKSYLAYEALKRRQTASLSKVNQFNFFPVSTDPKIVLIYTPSGLDHLIELAKGSQGSVVCHFLVFFNWYLNPIQILHIRKQLRQLVRMNSNFAVYPLCNSELEYRNFKVLAPEIKSYFINQNIVLDESIYKLTNSEGGRSGAVINARMLPFKRLELAANIKDLMVITCGWNSSQPAYRSHVRSILSHAQWPNIVGEGTYQKLTAEEVALKLNTRKVGLVFSKREGACFAATEYLLCGLPVVSTSSLGGRDTFFTEQNSRIVLDDARCVAQSVEDLSRKAPSPSEVRSSALAILEEHRMRFFQLVDKISAEHGVSRSFESEWKDVHRNKMMDFRSKTDFMDFLRM